eukprot:3014142-Rhodomonas_salina.1
MLLLSSCLAAATTTATAATNTTTTTTTTTTAAAAAAATNTAAATATTTATATATAAAATTTTTTTTTASLQTACSAPVDALQGNPTRTPFFASPSQKMRSERTLSSAELTGAPCAKRPPPSFLRCARE